MSYEDIKKTERAWAAEVANDLNNSSDKYVVYREEPAHHRYQEHAPDQRGIIRGQCRVYAEIRKR